MPRVPSKDAPEKLRPYLFQGVDLSYGPSDKEALAQCPFCGRERKFSVNIESGLWRCVACNEGTDNGKAVRGGNIYVFLYRLWSLCKQATTERDLLLLRADRGLISTDVIQAWGVVRSPLSGDWLVPGYGETGKLQQLYRYTNNGDRMLLMPTPGLGHKLHGINLWDRTKEYAYIAEGWGDGLALYETLAQAKVVDGGYAPTSNPELSLLSNANVVATPSASVLPEAYCVLFHAKHVIFLFDNDHRRKNTAGQPVEPAGYLGTKRAADMLNSSKTPPASISWLQWGEGEDEYNPNLKTGYDIRDFFNGTENPWASKQ